MGLVPRKSPALCPPLSGNMLPLVLCHQVAVHSVAAAASSCDFEAKPVSQCHQARPKAPSGSKKRKRRKSAPAPYEGWSAKPAKGQVPGRLVTSTHIVTDYILGRGWQPKS